LTSQYDDNFNDNLLDPKWTKDVDTHVTLEELNQEIYIRKDYAHNEYGHIEQACIHDLVTAIVKLKLGSTADISRWSTSLVLYWGVDNWVQIALRYNTTDPAKRYIYAYWNDASTVSNEKGSQGVSIGVYYWVKIALLSTEVKFYSSANGTSWNLIKTLTRPAGWSGAPAKFILGAGSSDNPDYPNPDFDNSKAGVSSVFLYVDEFTVQIYTPPKVVLNAGLATGIALTDFSASKGDTITVL